MSRSETPRTALDTGLLQRATGNSARSTPETMRLVLYALVPGALMQAWMLDSLVLVNLCVAMCAAMLFEALALKLRGRDVLHGIGDGSAALTGALLALSVTPLLPTWQLIVGTGIAILLAKHVFGGLGQNPFNPAMVAFAVLIVSFPGDMSHWPASVDPELRDQQAVVSTTVQWDAVTAQTPLDRHREQSRIDSEASAATDDAALIDMQVLGIAFAWLVGGLWLLWLRVITWHAPVALLATLAMCHALADMVSSSALPPVPALVAGASVFGAFFIVTDPVSGAATPRGRLIFGIGTGLLTFLIRQFGSWPEGFAFAVLIMNGAVPLIDRLERPTSA